MLFHVIFKNVSLNQFSQFSELKQKWFSERTYNLTLSSYYNPD